MMLSQTALDPNSKGNYYNNYYQHEKTELTCA